MELERNVVWETFHRFVTGLDLWMAWYLFYFLCWVRIVGIWVCVCVKQGKFVFLGIYLLWIFYFGDLYIGLGNR